MVWTQLEELRHCARVLAMHIRYVARLKLPEVMISDVHGSGIAKASASIRTF